MRLGLISNRLSQGNRAGLPETSGYDLIDRPIAGLDGLPEALDDFAAAEVDVIAVNGGDGTVSAVLSELLAKPRFAAPPALAILAGGTLNMCAADIGLKGRPGPALARLVGRLADGDLATAIRPRKVIAVARAPAAPLLCGLFFASAALYRAIVFCYDRVQPNSRSPRLAAAATMALLLGRLLGPEDALSAPERVSIALDDGPAESLDVLLTMATALDSLVFNIRPFWGREAGALRTTTLTHPPDRLIRRARRVLYGGPERGLPAASYRSHNVERMTIAPGLPFALDGELYEADKGQPLELSAVGPVGFLSC